MYISSFRIHNIGGKMIVASRAEMKPAGENVYTTALFFPTIDLPAAFVYIVFPL